MTNTIMTINDLPEDVLRIIFGFVNNPYILQLVHSLWRDIVGRHTKIPARAITSSLGIFTFWQDQRLDVDHGLDRSWFKTKIFIDESNPIHQEIALAEAKKYEQFVFTIGLNNSSALLHAELVPKIPKYNVGCLVLPYTRGLIAGNHFNELQDYLQSREPSYYGYSCRTVTCSPGEYFFEYIDYEVELDFWGACIFRSRSLDIILKDILLPVAKKHNSTECIRVLSDMIIKIE